jgi:N-acyl-D-aspartate/D-glutamate deacylase
MAALLLTGGLVVDGAGGPARNADVLIRDGRVEAIDTGIEVSGVDARDVTGRVVVPGFVDIH